jgi:methyl-accepting chemotaxis protein
VLGQRYRDALQKYPTIDAAAQQAIDVSVRGMDRPTSAGIDALVQNLQGKVKQRFADESAAAHSHMRNNLLLVGGIAAGLMALLLGAALAMARSVFNSLGAEPEHAVRATARIAGGDLTERLNAKTPKSLIGALEMMQSRLRNISLAIREVAFDIESRTTAMPQGPARELLVDDVDRLRAAIDRLQIDRQAASQRQS